MASTSQAGSPHEADEVAELRRCVRDLVALTALPAAWTAKDLFGVAQGLCDALLNVLGLEFAYIRLNNLAGRAPVQAVRTNRTNGLETGKLEDLLRPHLDTDAFRVAEVPIGAGELRVAVQPIGTANRFGSVAAGSPRAGFPTESERLLFSVGVNQAAIAVENALLLSALRQANRSQELLLAREKAARMEAEAAGNRFRDLIHGLDAIVWEANVEPFRFTFVSERVGPILGYTAETCLAEPDLWADLVHPEDRSRVAGLRRAVAAEGRPTDYEYRGIAADGHTVWLHDIVYVGRSAEGVPQVRGITVDVTGRKRTEEALLETEQRFTLFMEHLPGAAWMKDAELRYVYANETAERILRTSLRDLRGKTDRDVLDPDAAEQFERNDRLALASSQCLQAIETLAQPDGLHHSVVSKFPIFDAAGRPVLVGGIAIDITERKRAEEALEKSERRFRALIENSSDAIALAAADGRIVYASPSTVRVLGYTPEQFAGINARQLVHPEDLPAAQRILAEALARPGQAFSGQIRARHRDGTYRWIEGVATNLLASPDVGAFVANYRDITERKRFEEALQQSELRYSTLAEAIPGVLFANFPDGSSDYISRRFYEYTGMLPGSAEGFGWLPALHQEDRERTEARWTECLRDEKPFEMQYRLRRADGVYRWFATRSVPVRDGAGRVVKWFGVSMDIDEQKRAEEALGESQKLESIALLAGGVAHDFNNLLVGIMGNASLALDFLEPSHPTVSMLHEVVRASESAAGLTRQLLAYAGKGQITVQAVDISEVVRNVHPLIRTTIANADLELDLSPALPPAEGDPGQFQQLAMNLIINAAEAIGRDTAGSIQVRTGVCELDSAYIRTHFEGYQVTPGSHVYLQVADTGCGMDSETMKRIFEPFFSTKFTGRGLGLAAASGILRAHRGAIEVQSVPGKGSVFTVYLPAAQGCAERLPRQAGAAPAPADGGLILVVDDEEVVRLAATRALERFGFRVRPAASGAEAVRIFEESRGDLAAVLLDLTMPGMDGLETLRRFKTFRGDVPVLLSSGYSEMEARRRFEGQPLAGFIQKPYTAAQLAERLNDVVKQK